MRALGTIEGPVGALRKLSTIPYREGDSLWAAGCFAAPYQGLSPVRGNLHAGFLCGGAGRKARPLPDYRPSLRSPWPAAKDGASARDSRGEHREEAGDEGISAEIQARAPTGA